MPTARDSLLDAARAALGQRPWTAIRMVEVAAAAGVSRQTLYNEFRSKEGLARALVRRESEAYLAGVDRVLAQAAHRGADPGECFAAAAGMTLRTARRSALVRAALTGSPPPPDPTPAAEAPSGSAPAPATPPAPDPPSPPDPPFPSDALPPADTAPAPDGPEPAAPDLVTALHARTAAVLASLFPRWDRDDIAWACEAAIRLTLSYVIAPAPSDEAACLRVARLVRGLLPRRGSREGEGEGQGQGQGQG